MTDSNGVKVFEYDEVEFDAYNTHYHGHIEILDGNSYIKCKGGLAFLDDVIKKRDVVVIGNIHNDEEKE